MAVVTETHRGRRIQVRSRKDRSADSGRVWTVLINGHPASFVPVCGDNPEQAVVAQLRRTLDDIDTRAAAGDWGWEAHYYAPGTYETCEHGHPHANGGECVHFACVRKRAQTEE